MHFSKKLFFLLISCITLHSFTILSAQENQQLETVLRGNQLVVGAAANYEDEQIGLANATVLNPQAFIRLKINDDLLQEEAFIYTLELEITPVLSQNTLGESYIQQLVITYRSEGGVGEYNDLAEHVLGNARGVQIVINTITVQNLDTNEITTITPDNVILQLGYRAETFQELPNVIPSFTKEENTGLVFNLEWIPIQGAAEYELEWTWIDNYTDQSITTPKPANQISLTEREFKNNSTRIQTSANQYSIPLIYSRGYLVYRVRAVSRFLNATDTPYFGSWSTSGDAITKVSHWSFATITAHENHKNWQFQASYAEDGKKKEVVSYFDGTLRNRQTVTKINSDDKPIVGEVIYDYQGRPAIEILPVPVAANLGSDIKYYPDFNRSNSSGGILPFTKDNFEWEQVNADGTSCEVAVDGMSTNIGAGHYYGPTGASDPDKPYQQFVPDAERFPFSQIEYTPDNTGRIARKGGVGPTHQLGTGHEMKYYYGKVAAEELNRLFGADNVGNPLHYKKNMVMDPNGQISVSYIDPQGRTIATALVGESPSSLTELPDAASSAIGSFSLDLLDKKNADDTDTAIDANEVFPSFNDGTNTLDGLQHTSQQLSASATTKYAFNYTVKANEVYNPECLPNTAGYPVVANLDIAVTDECGKDIIENAATDLSQSIVLGSYNTANILATTGTINNTVAFDATPGIGSFSVQKKLVVDQDAMNAFTDDYITRLRTLEGEGCVPAFESFVSELPCFSTCEECEGSFYLEGETDAQAIRRFSEEQAPEYGGFDNIPLAIQELLEAEFWMLIEACREPCNDGIDFYSPEASISCESILFSLLNDMSIDGQYGLFHTTFVDGENHPEREYELSIFNSTNDGIIAYDQDGNVGIEEETDLDNGQPNVLFSAGAPSSTGNSWRSPIHYNKNTDAQHYYDTEGNISYIELTKNHDNTYTPAVLNPQDNIQTIDEKFYAEPQHLANLVDYVANWQDTWAASLILFHPEYCYYQYILAGCNIVQPTDKVIVQESDTGTITYLTDRVDMNSDGYDAYLLSINSFEHAKNAGIFSTGLYSKDPYFVLNPQGNDVAIDISEFTTTATTRKGIIEQAWEHYYGEGNGTVDHNLMEFAFLKYNPNIGANTINNVSQLETRPEMTPENLDEYTSVYIAQYLSLKQRIQTVFTHRSAKAKGGMNYCIENENVQTGNLAPMLSEYGNYDVGEPAARLCNGASTRYDLKKKAFPGAGALYNAEDGNQEIYDQITAEAGYEYYTSTGNCPMSLRLQIFLNEYVHPDNYTNDYSGVYLAPELFEQLSGSAYQDAGSEINISVNTTNGLDITVAPNTIPGIHINDDADFNWATYGSWRITQVSRIVAKTKEGDQFTFDMLARVEGAGVDGVFEEVIFTGTTIADVLRCATTGVAQGDTEAGEDLSDGNPQTGTANCPESADGSCINLLQADGTFENFQSCYLSPCTVNRDCAIPQDTPNREEGQWYRIGVSTFITLSAEYFKESGCNTLSSPQGGCVGRVPNDYNEFFNCQRIGVGPQNGEKYFFSQYTAKTSVGTTIKGGLRTLLKGLTIGKEYTVTYDHSSIRTRPDRQCEGHGTRSSVQFGDQIETGSWVPLVFSDSPESPIDNNIWEHNRFTFTATTNEVLFSVYGQYDTGISTCQNGNYDAYFAFDNISVTEAGCIASSGDNPRNRRSEQNPGEVNTPTPATACSPCIPDPVAVISCTEKYDDYTNIVSALGISNQFLDETITDSIEAAETAKNQFCEDQIGYLVDHYKAYLVTFGILNIDGTLVSGSLPNDFFITISEFGSININWGNPEMINIIDLYHQATRRFDSNDAAYNPASVDDEFPTWSGFASTYITAHKDTICPAINFIPTSDANLPEYETEDTCMEFAVNINQINIEEARAKYYAEKAAQFKQGYIDFVLNTIVETLDMGYDDKQYQYTLYYYDQAGNLRQTVPPSGVDRDDNLTDALEPQHTLKTEYKYNSLNQLIWQKTPDGGITRFAYDRLGRIIASQNAKQRLNYVFIGGQYAYADTGELIPDSEIDAEYSYTRYDALGRIVEAGEFTAGYPGFQITLLDGKLYTDVTVNDIAEISSTIIKQYREVTKTTYDKAPEMAISLFEDYDPTTARNRVTAVEYYDTYTPGSTSYTYATLYNYDIHGNVKELVQVNPALKTLNQDIKRIRYDYDLISGNVNQVTYQPGEKDQFIHRYEYDDDNRIVAVQTSTDGVIWERDATYTYYEHGPLARSEIGDKKVQGMDYAYTLQGWLKGVNAETLDPNTDIAKDGVSSGSNVHVAKDAIAYSLNYYSGDYKARGTTAPFQLADNPGVGSLQQLYNGNIRTMVTALMDTDENVLSTSLNNYTYDQLNRIKGMQNTELALDESVPIPGIKTSYTYDNNGNLKTLYREAKDERGTIKTMDQLSYHYNATTNQLNHVTDNITTGEFDVDIDSQDGDNYIYDEIGQLIEDKAEKLTIDWRVDGKVKSVRHDNGGNDKIITFGYDGLGNRVSKQVQQFGSGFVDDVTTYYVRDAQGNVMSTYRLNTNAVVGNVTRTLTLTEQHIFGSSRLGLQERSESMAYDPGNVAVLGLTAAPTENTIANNTIVLPTTGITTENSLPSNTPEITTGMTTNPTGSGKTLTNITAPYVAPVTMGIAPQPVLTIQNTRATTPIIKKDYTRTVGDKRYELSNHLGNVLGVVSDRKLVTTETAGSSVVYNVIENSAEAIRWDGAEIQGTALSIIGEEPQVTGTYDFARGTYRIVFDFDNQSGINLSFIVSRSTDASDTASHLSNISLTAQGNTSEFTVTNDFENLHLIFYDSGDPFEASVTNFRIEKQEQATGSIIDLVTFTSDVLTYNDYYPFGSLLPNRHGNSSDYRYGFNGKEADDELKGEGNSYDFGSRMYDPRIGRWFAEDPLFHVQPSSSPYSFANNNPVVLIDPDGELPIIPLLIKAGAAGAADLMMQVAMSYYFDDNVQNIGQAFDKVDYWQVSRSAAEGLIPWKVPGGRLGKAAATAVGDVLLNAGKAGVTGGEYSKSQAVQDFAVGFLGDLAGGGIMDLVKKYGGNKVLSVFKKLGVEPPCGCFTEGTQVYTEDGYKEIKDVEVGQFVWAYDEVTGKIELKKVVETFKYQRDHIYTIYVGDTVIEATNDHPFFVGGKWLKVENLKIGDELTLYNGSKVLIENIQYEKRNVTVYNFEVENYHTYYVTDKNILVHNSNCPFKRNQAGKLYAPKMSRTGLFGASSKQYRENLANYTGKSLDDLGGLDAHHMLPKKAGFSRFFKKNGIDVNDPQYMKWMDNKDHIGKFSTEYNNLWEDFIQKHRNESFSPSELMDKAKEFEKKAAASHAAHQATKKAKG